MKIESGIPIPEISHTGSGRKSIYPFKNMAVGDSVFFEGVGYQSKPMRAAKIYGPRFGFKFVGRTVDGGLRIWRVE